MKNYLPWIAAVVIGFLFLGPLGSLIGVLIYGGVKHVNKK